jgi:hypothetical protein
VDSGESVIKNNVELWGDLLCFDIENQRNLRGVDVRETKEEAKASARRPFWNFLSILERSIKDINGAAKNVGSPEDIVSSAHS